MFRLSLGEEKDMEGKTGLTRGGDIVCEGPETGENWECPWNAKGFSLVGM